MKESGKIDLKEALNSFLQVKKYEIEPFFAQKSNLE